MLPNSYSSTTAGIEHLLRRWDLATLRQCFRKPDGIEDGDMLLKSSRKVLIEFGMLHRRVCKDGSTRTFVTDHGEAVVRANASCIDGSEGYGRHE